MLRLMDFYKCYRAYVRGKVESFHQARAEVPETEKKKAGSKPGAIFVWRYGKPSADQNQLC